MVTELLGHTIVLGYANCVDCVDCDVRIFGRNHKLNASTQRKRLNKVIAVYGNKCLYCNSILSQVTIDHVVPVSKGGTSAIWNTVPSCSECNCSKDCADLENWIDTSKIKDI